MKLLPRTLVIVLTQTEHDPYHPIKQMSMTRQIKFRAWVNQEGMEKPEMHHFNLGQGFSGMEDCPIMQFTGLLDKNGKEIYEGDIVVWVSIQPSGKGIIKSRPRVVRWVNQRNCSGFNVALHPDHENRTEIFGNIYESPDLLLNNKSIK